MSESKEVAVQDNIDTSAMLANPDALDNIIEVCDEMGKKAEEGHNIFIKLSKSGAWVTGEDEDPIDTEKKLIINPTYYEVGAVAYCDNEFVDEKTVKLFSGQPIPNAVELNETHPVDAIDPDQDKWKSQHGIPMVPLEGGTPYMYKTSSFGGIKTLQRFMGIVGKRMKEDKENCFPVVQLDVDSYKHKKYGKTYTPVISILHWANIDGEIIEDYAPE